MKEGWTRKLDKTILVEGWIPRRLRRGRSMGYDKAVVTTEIR